MMNVHEIEDDTNIASLETTVGYHDYTESDDIGMIDPYICIATVAVCLVAAIKNLIHTHKMNKETLKIIEELDRVTSGDNDDNS